MTSWSVPGGRHGNTSSPSAFLAERLAGLRAVAVSGEREPQRPAEEKEPAAPDLRNN
jgi:hypothetical protein